MALLRIYRQKYQFEDFTRLQMLTWRWLSSCSSSSTPRRAPAANPVQVTQEPVRQPLPPVTRIPQEMRRLPALFKKKRIERVMRATERRFGADLSTRRLAIPPFRELVTLGSSSCRILSPSVVSKNF